MRLQAISEGSGPTAAARLLVGCGLVSLLSLPTLYIYPFGVFAIAIANSTGWPRQQVAATIGPALLLSLFAFPLNGWLIQKFHKPTLAVLAQVGAAAGLVLLALAPSDLQLFRWLLTTAVLLSTLTGPAITSALVAENFNHRRGLALGVVMACTGVGVAAIPILAAKLISIWGWRTTYGALAAATLTAAITNVFLLRSPAGGSVEPGDDLPNQSTAAPRIFAAATFWTMAAFFFVLALAANAIPVHLPLILQERGSSTAAGALSLTVIGLTMIASRPVMGYVLDRLPVRTVLALLLAGPLAGSAGLFLTRGSVIGSICAAGFGLAIGGEFVCMGYMVSRAFPLSRFGTVHGWLSLAFGAGQALGPIAISAVVARAAGGYDPALLLVMTASLIALGLGLCLRDSSFREAGTEHVQVA